MFCPQCGLTPESDEIKFCKSCGANLHAVRQAVATRDDRFDWSKTWVAEMFLSEAERKRRNHELERQRGITPEVKRYNEVKAGVITGSVGLALMIFLFIISEGIIRSGGPSAGESEIISRVWAAGFIPLFVGLALIVNGLFVSRKLVELAKRERLEQQRADALEAASAEQRRALRPADTSEFQTPQFSVTEGTTKHLENATRER
ncbi:MAG TPA: hypothetical protein VER32_03940 [Pyrinomonadaceae bacterium]|nr:hypothetical protein [Pyrinomonadaceae bacterium]